VKVGVAVPVRNALPYLGRCLSSIQEQTYPCGAYVVEDVSDDDTWRYLRDHPASYRQVLRNRERMGWPSSLNRAARAAIDDGCDAVFTMNADDYLHPECIARCVDALHAGHDWAVVYAQQVGGENTLQVSKENATLADFGVWPPLVNYALIRGVVWDTVGGYSNDVTVPGSYGCAEDWEFWIKVFKAGFTRYAVVKEPLYFYVMHPGQLHEQRPRLHAQTVELIRRKHPDVPWNPAMPWKDEP